MESTSLQTIEGEEEEEELAVDSELQIDHEESDTVSQQEDAQTPEIAIAPTNDCNGVQFVGDNIDLNIGSINGNTAFHAMGMIKIALQQTAI